MKQPLAALCLVAISCGGSSSPADESTPRASGPARSQTPTTGPAGTTLSADARAFAEIAPFVTMAPSHGDKSTGPHGTFGQMSGKQGSPPHTHSGSYHGVVLRGVIENPFGTEASPSKLGPGSYWFVPAGAEHITRCVSDETCEFYFHAASAFDFAPVKAMTQSRPGDAISLRAADLEWVEIAPFVKMAAAYGDRSKGAHGSFGRFPGGAESPVHTHSADYHAIVLSGTMTNPFNREPSPPTLGPGSSWFVPAGSVHKTACVSSEPCLFYFTSESGFDFSPAGAE